jgi:nucleoid-associated protein YgaU
LALLAPAGAGCAKKDEAGGTVTTGPETPAVARAGEEGKAEPEVIADASQMPGRIHIVEPKDTLLQLSERYYRDRNQWRRIWQANKNRLSNPNDLPVGMKLIIP